MDTLTANSILEAKAAAFVKSIKQDTETQHLQLESQSHLAAIMKPEVTRLRYHTYLSLMNKVEEAYELSIVPLLNNIISVQHISSSILIKDDLQHIEVAESKISHKHFDIPADVSIPFALGFMYVMEGSKLGGKVIYKHIHRTLGYTDDSGGKFISDHGNDTFGNWKTFMREFSIYVVQHNCEAEAIRGAAHAFSSIFDFFESHSLVYEN